MSEYPKIQSIWHRDPATNMRTFIEGQWSMPEFEYLKDCQWRATEKIDGTNVRVMWDGMAVRFGGRSDDAQMQPKLLKSLEATFMPDRMKVAFDGPACLYGEGYGATIQKCGGRYSSYTSFILFDVLVDRWWLQHDDVQDVANKLTIRTVPVVKIGTLEECIDFGRCGFKSTVSIDTGLDAEGLVMQPLVPLFNRKGHRIITKVKARDFIVPTNLAPQQEPAK